MLADPGRLRNAGVTLDDLVHAVAGSNGATSGGYLRQGESEAVVRAQGYLRTPARHPRTPSSRRPSGTPVLVRNVADVVEAYTPLRGAVARGAAHDSVEGTILLRRGENPRDVLDGVHEAVARINRDILPPGHADRPVLRSHAAGRHDAGDGVAQHARGRGAGQPGAVAVPARGQWLDRRRHHHAARAADGVRRAALRGRAREPALDGRDRLRHPARRRRHPGRERLPAAGPGAPSAGGRRQHRGARGQGGRAPDAVLDVDHRRGDDADLHARARRGPHLPPRRADVRVRAAGRAVLHA